MFIIKAPKPELADALIMDDFISYRGKIAMLSSMSLDCRLVHVRDEYQEHGMLQDFESTFMNAVTAQAKVYSDMEARNYEKGTPDLHLGTDEYYADNMASDQVDIRALVARNGKFLNTLVADCHWQVRAAVASYFIGKWAFDYKYESDLLDLLVTDEDWRVRKAVADTAIPKYIKILRQDANDDVIASVICFSNSDFALKHANSNSVNVRISVAEMLREDDLLATNLIHDKEAVVRHAIACRGIFADIFKRDEDEEVRNASKTYEIPF